MIFVISVTRIATVSSPPARRVQTAAEASVQGMVAATIKPPPSSIDKLAADPAYRNLVILRLDYDSQVSEKKALGISKQSTLIAYRGTHEIGRIVGITDPSQLRAFAAAALR